MPIRKSQAIAILTLICVWLASGVALADAAGADAPLEVGVSIKVEQVVFVDQKSENFGVVANIVLAWKDPKLAFDASAYGKDYKVLQPDAFNALTSSVAAINPKFIVHNQQNQKWVQQALYTVEADGVARYYERSTITLQAPHFDFRQFPFDSQAFYVEITSVHPQNEVRFVPGSEPSGLGDLLGEEAWILEGGDLQANTIIGLSGLESDQVALAFSGRRHIEYYAIRIFLPMIVLILVCWMTFFLDEYRRRIEITSANLLAFIVFNFAVSDKLPELGYLTFLDFVLQWMFIVTGAVIILNVGLTRLVVSGREATARRIDNYVIKWIYPMGYVAVVAVAVLQFLVLPNATG